MAEEIDPLNPASLEDEESAFNDDDTAIEDFEPPEKLPRDPLYILIFYGLSFLVSVGGFVCCIWGWRIALTAPFDDDSKKTQRESYEKYFIGMQSVVILLFVNMLWSFLNLRLALKGSQDTLWLLNMAYDFLIWALLIAFGVLNMVEALWDRRLCNGLPDELDEKCDKAAFRLLVVELVAVNLGLLVAVIHFILLIARCCTQSNRNAHGRSIELRTRIQQEEQALLSLMQRRHELIAENEALDARRNKSLPSIPSVSEDYNENEGAILQEEEDLIDMVTEDVASPKPTGENV